METKLVVREKDDSTKLSIYRNGKFISTAILNQAITSEIIAKYMVPKSPDIDAKSPDIDEYAPGMMVYGEDGLGKVEGQMPNTNKELVVEFLNAEHKKYHVVNKFNKFFIDNGISKKYPIGKYFMTKLNNCMIRISNICFERNELRVYYDSWKKGKGDITDYFIVDDFDKFLDEKIIPVDNLNTFAIGDKVVCSSGAGTITGYTLGEHPALVVHILHSSKNVVCPVFNAAHLGAEQFSWIGKYFNNIRGTGSAVRMVSFGYDAAKKEINVWFDDSNCTYRSKSTFSRWLPYDKFMNDYEIGPENPDKLHGKYYTHKVVCVENDSDTQYAFRVGGIYEFINGVIADADGFEIDTMCKNVTEFNQGFASDGLKFVPIDTDDFKY